MVFLGELRVEATRASLMPIAYFVNGIGHRLRLTEETLSDVELAVEEAATNIIEYAYPGGGAGEIVLRAEVDGDALHVVLTDWGAPFTPDPAKFTPVELPLEARAEGGMGLQLIHRLMDEVRHQAGMVPNAPNVLTLVKRITRAATDRLQPSALRELDALQTVSQVMSTSIGLDDLLKLIIDKLVEAIDAERGTLYLIDEQAGELYSKVLLENANVLSEIRVKLGEGIAGYVAATGEVLNIQHAYADPRFHQAIDRATGYHTESILTAPLRNPQQKIIGVVQVLNKVGGPFSARDERMLVAMAAQAAISIENARLHAQEIRQRLINQELDTARAIQQSFLPSSLPEHPGWEVCAYWRPAQNVAGDFYDFQPLGDGRWAFVIADVSGKGVPAALFMALSVTVLRFALTLDFSASELLSQVNRSLISFNRQSQMFASIFVGYLDFDTGQMSCSSAGHNPCLHYHAATGACEWVRIPGVIAGIFPDLEYAEHTLPFEPGDVLVLYTDGITEAINLADDEFGEERLEALVRAGASGSAQGLVRAVIDAVAGFSGERGAFDDETLVIIKRLGGGLA